jgi:hypothetical protein
MTAQSTPDRSPNEACANCGAPLSGDYCAACGQSREDIRRPALSLVTETLDGLLSWDGRLLTTFRQLFTRPGRVARDYADGRRQRYTPPVRLYLIVSLVFFALMTVSGVRIIAVDLSEDGPQGPGVRVTMFQPPRDDELPRLSTEVQDDLLRQLDEAVGSHWSDVARLAMNEPEILEQRSSAAASQAFILMVVLFGLFCAILHPRRRIIEHAIHALYFHAAILIPFAAGVIAGVLIPMPLLAAAAMAAALLVVFVAALVLFDRGFYGSSWIGAGLRTLALLPAYALAAVAAGIGMIFLGTL